MSKIIQFSPPYIDEREIEAVTSVLKSGWITTGPKVKEFEDKLASFCKVEKALCVNSATAGLELVLRIMDIGEGDEVITTPYTFTATSNIILHTGAKVVFADTKDGSFNIDPNEIERLITSKTKAVISVDVAGVPVDYQAIIEILNSKKSLYSPKKGSYQEKIDKTLFLSDTAHSFGSSYKGVPIGGQADFSVFSFHAVKNLTTGEGGAITFNNLGDVISEELYKKIKLYSLHGQSKDALAKFSSGNYKYTIELAGYKYNMMDIVAAIGIVQLEKYESEILPKRKKIYETYYKELSNDDRFILPENSDDINYHIFPLRLKNYDEEKRDTLITKLFENGIHANVHFIPLPLHPLYKNLGYKIDDYPNTYNQYKNEVSLPIYPSLNFDDLLYVIKKVKEFA